MLDYKISEWSIERCPHCQFAKIDPLPTQTSRPVFYSKDNIQQRFKKKRSPARQLFKTLKSWTNNTFHWNKSSIFQQKIEHYVKKGGKVFDVGCGDGSFLNQIRDNYQCYGIEISDYLAERAVERGMTNVKTGNFLTMDLGADRYDALTMISIIEHIDQPKVALQQCFDHLKDGGVLLLKTPNYNCLLRSMMGKKWSGLRPPDHVVYFNPTNLKKLLKDIGFKKFKTRAWPMSDNMYIDAWK